MKVFDKLNVLVLLPILLFMSCLLVGGYVVKKRGIPFVKRVAEYSIGIYTGSSPFNLSPPFGISNPVLTAKDVTDVEAEFVADPFMVKEKDKWYMFFEVLNKNTQHGDIGFAISDDGFEWKYKQLVLDEPFHLSYPNVFKWNGEYFMVPETRYAYAVRLYKAVDFPYKWNYVKDLIVGNYLDPSVFYYNDKWWIFVSERCDVLHLFYADDLTGPWQRHPASPVIKLDGNIARPGGPVLLYNNKLFRFTQDCDPTYGNLVRAFEITELTTTGYEEKIVSKQPILRPTGYGWNAEKMHHIDPHKFDGFGWIACVDGYGTSIIFGLGY